MNIEQAFKKWCKETGRSGGVIMGSSLREFFNYFQQQQLVEPQVTQPEQEEAPRERHVGYLKKEWGIKGFVTAKPGHPVYATADRYKIYLHQPNSDKIHEVVFYKEMLGPLVNFLEP